MLYTSGSTGKLKGLVHTQAGYLLYTGMTHQVNTVVVFIAEPLPLVCMELGVHRYINRLIG